MFLAQLDLFQAQGHRRVTLLMTSLLLPGLLEEEDHMRVIHFHPFSIDPAVASLIFMVFLLLYLRSHIGNVTTGLTVWQDHSLHSHTSVLCPFFSGRAGDWVLPSVALLAFARGCHLPLSLAVGGSGYSFSLSWPGFMHGSRSAVLHPEALGSITKPLSTTHLKACP